MKNIITLSLFMCLYEAATLNLPGPSVYVVTPSSKLPSANEGRSAPFYYHNWMRRMDSLQNATTTISTTTPKVETPDLIFAEFESDSGDNMRKSIRKLLEKEKVGSKTSTTMRPLYVPDEEETNEDLHQIVYGSPAMENNEENKQEKDEITDYSTMYNNLYNNAPAPIYVPSTSESATKLTTSTSTPASSPIDVQNIWHIIDREKYDQYSGKWNEVPISSERVNDVTESINSDKQNNEDNGMDENFSLPGFGTNPGNGAENESRAIRTEPNIRFPYVSLKPFQMKKPLQQFLPNSKKGNNMFTSLDSFHDVKNPVRGEAQDVVHMRQPIDRYNPAQPYLPQDYGSKSKQSIPSTSKATKTVANLVPPPPPPPPQSSGNDFPIPTNYESFPPYPPSVSDSTPVLPQPSLKPPASFYQPPSGNSDDSDSSSDDSNNDGSPLDMGYQYRPPSGTFVPTLPPVSKPFSGYSYNKPMVSAEAPPPMNMGGYTYSKPAVSFDTPQAAPMGMDGYTYMKPQPPAPEENADFPGYSYDKPDSALKAHDHPPVPSESPSYGHHDVPPYHHDSDYPELIYNKPHGGSHDTKETSDSKEKDMGMMPPPPPPDMKPDMDGGSPPDDHGFPHDFPGGLKYHDFDDHDFDHYHHHHTTTTTTTTEMPRVNRYSYYYLGKKLYYLPLYFSIYFIVYVGALIIKAVLRHKIVYPNSWRPNDQTASFFSKRSVDSWDFSHENLHEVTGRVTKAIADAAEKYMSEETKKK